MMCLTEPTSKMEPSSLPEGMTLDAQRRREAEKRSSGFEIENDRYAHVPDSYMGDKPHDSDNIAWEGGPLSEGMPRADEGRREE